MFAFRGLCLLLCALPWFWFRIVSLPRPMPRSVVVCRRLSPYTQPLTRMIRSLAELGWNLPRGEERGNQGHAPGVASPAMALSGGFQEGPGGSRLEAGEEGSERAEGAASPLLQPLSAVASPVPLASLVCSLLSCARTFCRRIAYFLCFTRRRVLHKYEPFQGVVWQPATMLVSASVATAPAAAPAPAAAAAQPPAQAAAGKFVAATRLASCRPITRLAI